MRYWDDETKMERKSESLTQKCNRFQVNKSGWEFLQMHFSAADRKSD